MEWDGGVTWRVAVDLVFTDRTWDTGETGLKSTGSEFYSEFTEEMRQLWSVYTRQRGVDTRTAYLFWFAQRAEDDAALQGNMPLRSQFGFIFSRDIDNVYRTMAHELAHGSFQLRHTFGDRYKIPKSTTDNLMDYTNGTVLKKYQWDLIHDPMTMPFVWAQGEEEGAMVGFSDYKGTRQIIEQIRFGYAFNRSVTISHDKSIGTGAENITLGDGVKYEKLLIGFHRSLPITINPRSCELSDDFSVLGNTGALRTGFCFAKQTNSRAFYAVEIESKTANNEFINLKKYLLCENKDKWSRHIDHLINAGGYSLANLSALSGEALRELTNKQRIDMLKKIARVNMKDYDPLASRVMANVPTHDIPDLFEKLKQTTLFYTFKNEMNHDNYTEFIKSATLLYYRQDMLKEKLLNLSPDMMFVHQYREGPYGISFTNVFSATATEYTITGNILIKRHSTVKAGHPEDLSQQLDEITFFQAYSKKVNYFDLVGVKLNSDLGNIKANGMVVPMPAFYFDWLYTNQKRENTIKAIDASITILSLAVGIGELRAIAAAGRFMFVARTTAGIVRSSVNLVLLDDEIRDVIRYETAWGREFLIWWDKLWWVYDIATFDLQTINKNRDFFNDFVIAWNGTKDVLKARLDKELFDEIQVFINEVEQNK